MGFYDMVLDRVLGEKKRSKGANTGIFEGLHLHFHFDVKFNISAGKEEEKNNAESD